MLREQIFILMGISGGVEFSLVGGGGAKTEPGRGRNGKRAVVSPG